MAYQPDPNVLLDQERLFCEYMLLVPNASEAARMAGYSENGVAKAAQRLMKRDRVIKCIAELRQQRAARLDVSQDELIVRISALARKAEMRHDYKAAGSLLLELLRHVSGQGQGRKVPGGLDEAAPAEDPRRVEREGMAQMVDIRDLRKAAIRARKSEA